VRRLNGALVCGGHSRRTATLKRNRGDGQAGSERTDAARRRPACNRIFTGQAVSSCNPGNGASDPQRFTVDLDQVIDGSLSNVKGLITTWDATRGRSALNVSSVLSPVEFLDQQRVGESRLIAGVHPLAPSAAWRPTCPGRRTCHARNPVPPAHLFGPCVGFLLSQNPDDLLLREAASFHRPSPFFRRRTLAHFGGIFGVQAFPYGRNAALRRTA
jgi:hypothetical protein